MRKLRFRPGLFAVLLVTACLTPTDGSGRFGEARVKPQFADGATPDQRGIHVDSIHTVIRRGDQDVVNAVMPYDADAHQAWIIELNSVADDVVVTMELLVGRSVAYRGTRDLTVTEGTAGRAPLENVLMSYVGTNIAARVEVLPEAIALNAVGATRQLQAVVYDPDGAVLDKAVSWSSANEGVATVDEHGLVTAIGTGNSSITATVDGASDAATVVVDTAIAHSSTITADSASIAANGSANTRITVRILNHDGMPIGASAGTVTLAATLGTLGAVTDHLDGTYTATLTAGTSAGDAVVTGELNGVAMSDDAVVQFRALTPGSARTTTIVADSAALDANGGASTVVRVVVRDVNGNPLNASSGSVQLETTLGTLSGVVDHDNGTYSATLTAATTVGTAAVTGTLNGEAIADTAFVQMRPLAPHASTTTIAADSAAINADGTSTTLVTVEVRDVNGNLIGRGGDAVTLATTLGTLTSITGHANGRYTAVLTAGTVAGTAHITGTLNGAPIADNALVRLRPLPSNPLTTIITADSAAIDADGVSRTLVQVVVRDGNGNPVAGGDTVRLSTTLGTLSAVTDHADGTYSATLTAATTTGLAAITGTLNSGVIADTAFVQMRPLEPHPLNTTITADSSAIDANATSATLVTVQVRDINGNLVGHGGATVAIVTTLGTPSAVTDHGDGRYTAILTAGIMAGTANVTGTLNSGVIGDTAFVQFRPLPAAPLTTTITADSAAINADATSTTLVTVEVRDINGNLVGRGGDVVRLATTLGTLSTNITDHADGRYTAILTAGTVAGIATITGTVNDAVIADTARVELRPLTAAPTNTTLVADSTSIAINARSTTTITAIVRDRHGNPVGRSSGTVILATTRGFLSSTTDHGDGTYTARLMADTLLLPDTAVVTGTLNGEPIADTARVEFRHEAGSALQTTIDADSASLVVGSFTTTTVTVTLRDAAGNRIYRSAGTVLLQSTLGRLSLLTDHQNGLYTALLKVETQAGTAVVSGSLNGTPIVDTAAVVFRE